MAMLLMKPDRRTSQRRIARQPSTANIPEVARSTGERLPVPLEDQAVASFGESIRSVRVHTDGPAHSAAEQLHARAFTTGNDIYFARNAFRPSNGDGQRLIGHELAHVLQQRTRLEPERLPDRNNLYEREADVAARSFLHRHPVPTSMAGRPATSSPYGSGIVQRSADDSAKGKGHVELFVPTIEDSVGAGGTNAAADVKVVQILLNDQDYNLEVTGIMDPPTQAAILAFQKKTFPKWTKYDGRIDVQGKAPTWNALSQAYQNPDEVVRERKQFAKRRSVMISPTDVTPGAGGLAFVSDKNSDGLDDFLGSLQQAASANPSVDNIRAKGVRQVAAVLQNYYDQQMSVDTLYVTSHGYYKIRQFLVGDELINESNLNRLRILRNLLAPSTKLVVMACHLGGGSNPEDAPKFARRLAQTLGITVYTSRSWTVGWNKAFTAGKSASSFSRDAHDYSKNRHYAYKYLGQWLEATPGKEKATVRAVNTPVYEDDGGFHLSKTRFPGYSRDQRAEFQALLASETMQ